MILGLLILFIPIDLDSNYVELIIRLEKSDHIQLFIQGYDTIPKYSEKISYWKKLDGGMFHTVRWQLPQIKYKRIRIDLSTKFPQTVSIASIEYNLGGVKKKMNGVSILKDFVPNGFIEYLSGNEYYIIFKTKPVRNEFDPIFKMGNDIGYENTNFNTHLSVDFYAKSGSLMSIEIFGQSGSWIITQSYNSGISHLDFGFYTEEEPIRVLIKPSIGNLNFISLSNILYKREGKKKNWNAGNIFGDYLFNQDFDTIYLESDNLNLSIDQNSGFRSASMEVSSIIFPIDVIIRKIYLFLLFLLAFIILLIGNNKLIVSNFNVTQSAK